MGDDEEARKRNRLESIVRMHELTWKHGIPQQQQNKDASKVFGRDHHDWEEEEKEEKKKKNEKEGRRSTTTYDKEDDGIMLSLLSPELCAQFMGMGNNALVVLPSKRRKKSNNNKNAKKALPPLTPLEIKAAKAVYKNTKRKLAQLEMCKKLEEHTLIKRRAQLGAADNNGKRGFPMNDANMNIDIRQAQGLLLKSSELGKKLTKKERLKQLHRKEALGIGLTREEMDTLYVKHIVPLPESFPENNMGVGDDDNDGIPCRDIRQRRNSKG